MSEVGQAGAARRLALVTGGSRGIGRACTIELARSGYDVAVFYRSNAEALAQTKELTAETGSDVEGFAVDVADEHAVRAGFRQVGTRFGRKPATIICSSGIVDDGLAATMSSQRFQNVIQTNLVGTFYVCREGLKAMRRDGGSIVLVSSTAGIRGNAGQANYAASKGGVNALARALAKEAAAFGIRVNAVAPGFTETDMLHQMDQRSLVAILPHVPMSRVGTPSEIAKAVVFLAGTDASYITGVVLAVDGGLSA